MAGRRQKPVQRSCADCGELLPEAVYDPRCERCLGRSLRAEAEADLALEVAAGSVMQAEADTLLRLAVAGPSAAYVARVLPDAEARDA